MRIILGIGGGIAAYKAAMLLRLFSEEGHDVVPIPTAAALEFVGAPTWEALSGHPVRTSVFEAVEDVNHVRQAEEADLVVVAPATADLLARLAAGRADDLLTATVLTARCPVVLAPAMHTQMWENPATQRSVRLLREYGHTVIEPASGRLTGRDSGVGRLPEPETIKQRALAVSADRGPVEGHAASRAAASPSPASHGVLHGRRIVVTAGGTREPLDPVRYLGNRSSGKQGVAIARAAAEAGAEVRLIAAHTEIPDPPETDLLSITRVSSALELETAVNSAIGGFRPDAVIMAAAVADFRPKDLSETKIKKDPTAADAPVVELVRNPDILRGLVTAKEKGEHEALLVGFAAETGSPEQSVEELGRAKLASKGCDILVVNRVGTDLVFGKDDTAASFLIKDDDADPIEVRGTKDDVARRLMTTVASYMTHPQAESAGAEEIVE